MGWRSDLLQKLPPRTSMTIRARYGFSREPEMEAVRRFVRPGDHCLDIGAHLGIYTYLLLENVGPSGHVTAFEPQPTLADYLDKAFAPEIRGGRVEVHRVALGSEAGMATLSLPREGRALNRGRASLLALEDSETISVPVRRLDDLDLPRIAFIKCDVEGFELATLRGGATVLQRDHPVLLVEIEERHAGERVLETFTWLRDLDYAVAVYRESDDSVAVVTSDATDVPTAAAEWAGSYVNNFFFVPPRLAALLDGAPRLGA